MRRSARALLAFIAGAFAASCGGDSAAPRPQPGRLAIEAIGLPIGVEPDISVSGSSGYARVIRGSETLDSLTAGTYTLTAPLSIITESGRYVAAPASQTVVVSAGALAVAQRITFSVTSGDLTVSIVGLPAQTAGAVAVTGPGGYTQSMTGSLTLASLAPGLYTLGAADVQSGGTAYHPDPATQTIDLAAGTAPHATITYGAGTAALDLTVAGIPTGTNAAVVVTSPSGATRLVTQSATLRYLAAGTYTIAAAVVGSNLTTYTPSATSQSITIADAATSAVTVTYAGAALQLTLQPVVAGLVNASFATAPPGDSRLFIVERAGRVRIFSNGALSPTPWVDISPRVNSTGERGMLSIAFDPEYRTNGYVYAYYVGTSGDMVVERWTSTPGSNEPITNATVVISFAHGGENHHGGLIAFGPDRMLYVAPGDGGCCGDPHNNAQNLTSFLGKILRLNVRTLPYTIPAGNPYITDRAARPEIWAYGVRNPWRYAFDEPAGLLYIGDVGNDAREEVDVVPATGRGYNFGWRLMEGFSCFDPATGCNPNGALTLPVLDYPHTDGCSVTAGYVYRGAAIPELTGHFLYSDYCRGWLRSFRGTADGAADQHSWNITAPGTLSFGRDGAGEIYMLTATTLAKIVRQ
ncbi:MAG: PQQ-dependent sugar dehydrogenase [Gemmatimonadaceae bacterium]